MRFYTTTHKHHRGIDLHAKSMYVYILNQEGDVVLHRNMKAKALWLPCSQARKNRLFHAQAKGTSPHSRSYLVIGTA
jgi:hypothetical protein